jgi:hypothetical protein
VPRRKEAKVFVLAWLVLLLTGLFAVGALHDGDVCSAVVAAALSVVFVGCIVSHGLDRIVEALKDRAATPGPGEV